MWLCWLREAWGTVWDLSKCERTFFTVLRREPRTLATRDAGYSGGRRPSLRDGNSGFRVHRCRRNWV